MNERIFHYLSPLMFPVLPREAGTLMLEYDMQHVLDVRGTEAFDGTLNLRIALFADGSLREEEVLSLKVAAGKVAEPLLAREFSLDRLGYLELHIEADRPVFRKILAPPGYALLCRDGFGEVVVTSDQKYANPRVIDEIASTGTFCMLHTAGRVDSQAGEGNALLLINPYEQDLVARVVGATGRSIKRRVRTRSAELVPLDAVLDDGGWSSYMVGANNRVLTYDVRHRYGRPFEINSMDHLDVFSGMPTHRHDTLVEVLRAAARRSLRETGLRIT